MNTRLQEVENAYRHDPADAAENERLEDFAAKLEAGRARLDEILGHMEREAGFQLRPNPAPTPSISTVIFRAWVTWAAIVTAFLTLLALVIR